MNRSLWERDLGSGGKFNENKSQWIYFKQQIYKMEAVLLLKWKIFSLQVMQHWVLFKNQLR